MSATFRLQTPGVAAGLVIFWVQLYTAGLSSESRSRRVDQILSDIWEHYSDRSAQASPALIGLEILGRAARGAAADLFWRFQLEEPQMQINIPIERIAGACLLALVAAAMLSLNVAGYDTSVEGFDSELRRLASVDSWQAGIYTSFQVLSGIGMLASAVVLYLTLRRYTATLATLAAVALAAAGLLVLVNSALYATAVGVADEYVAASTEQRGAILTVGRAFMVMLATLTLVMAVMLALSVYGFAMITARHHLVPSWLNFVAGGSVLTMGATIVTELMETEISWLFFITFLGLLLLWLIVAGFWLLLGGSRMLPEGGTAITVEQTAPTLPQMEPDEAGPIVLNRWLIGATCALFAASLLAVGALGVPGMLMFIVPGGFLVIAIAHAMSRRTRIPGAQP